MDKTAQKQLVSGIVDDVSDAILNRIKSGEQVGAWLEVLPKIKLSIGFVKNDEGLDAVVDCRIDGEQFE